MHSICPVSTHKVPQVFSRPFGGKYTTVLLTGHPRLIFLKQKLVQFEEHRSPLVAAEMLIHCINPSTALTLHRQYLALKGAFVTGRGIMPPYRGRTYTYGKKEEEKIWGGMQLVFTAL